MDLSTIGGLLLAFGLIAAGAILEHTAFSSLLGPSAFLIVIGGSLGATVLSHSMDDLKMVGPGLKMIFSPPKLDYGGMIDYLVGLAEKARRNGLLSLQDDAEKATNKLVRRGLTMAVDGSDPESIQTILEAMSEMDAADLKHGAAVMETAGGYSPTLGILGTVMGLIGIMRNLNEPDTLGPKIAVAFLATLYGVAFANLIALPFGAKIKAAVSQQTQFNQMIIEGIIGLQSGENPRNLREKLVIFQRSHSKGKGGTAFAPQEGD